MRTDPAVWTLVALALLSFPGSPAHASETVGPFTVTAAPIEASVVFGSVPADDWLNVVNAAVSIDTAFSGTSIIDDGFANLARVNTSNVHIEMKFSPGIVNGAGDDLVILMAQFSAVTVGLSTSYDGFATTKNVQWFDFVDTGEDRSYYYGKTVGPYSADVHGAPIDLSSFGIPECEVVDRFRLILYEGSEADPLGIGALAPSSGLSLSASPAAVSSGDTLDLTTCLGMPGGLGLLYVVDVNGSPTFLRTAKGNFDPMGSWSVAGTIPPNLSGLVVDFLTLGHDRTGGVGLSNPASVTFL